MVKQIVRDIFFLGQPSKPATKADQTCALPIPSHKSRYPDWEGSAGHTAGEPGTVRWYGCKYDWCKEEYYHCEYGIYRCCYV